jgi:membrane-bound PQQ-dependent dehydrogenase (glucose/quinate/shikimate family)
MLKFTAILIGMLGALMSWQGAELAGLGGSPYFVAAGAGMMASAVGLWRGKPWGFHVFGAVLLLTLAWAVYEAGNSFWLVGSRIWIIGLLAIWLCTPVIRRQLWPAPGPDLWRIPTVIVGGLASFGVLAAMTFELLDRSTGTVAERESIAAHGDGTWGAYGATHRGTRYAAHSEVNRENVQGLERIWEISTGRGGRFSATPIQVGDGLYLCTSQNVVIALDAETGGELWRFDPENETPPWGILGNCRGVTYYKLPDAPPGSVCAERIFTATTDARMIALDRFTGEPCADFGTSGEISLLAGMGDVKPLYYFVTSPPVVASGSLAVGGWVMDNQEVEEPSGVVRGYDPRTGNLLWAWDMGREGQTQGQTQGQAPMPPEGGYYTRGTPNVWSLMSADDELGLVYVPTGNATPDYFGAHRTAVMEKYASSIVAIDARTGLARWHFQTTHHDIWDYDVPSQPTLADITLNGVVRKVVVVPTKRGELFMLDRATGEVLTEVTEKPVPASDLPEERTSPTQPFSTGMPSFAHSRVTEQDLFGVSPFDQMACRKTFLGLRYDGPLTPPSVRGTLLYPGPAGGMNWGSVAVDEARQLMVVNTMHLPFVVHMIPREQDEASSEAGFNRGYGIGGPQRGTAYAAKVRMFASPLGMPCLKPPFGEIAVVDLSSQEIVWRRSLGFWQLGFPYAAGSIVTGGGLIFMGGVADGYLRAFDELTGEVLWEDALPSPSDATPMTYVSPKSRRQMIIVTVPAEQRRPDTAHEQTEVAQPNAGGRVIAYALAANPA